MSQIYFQSTYKTLGLVRNTDGLIKIEYQELQYPFMVLDELMGEFYDISENQTNKL